MTFPATSAKVNTKGTRKKKFLNGGGGWGKVLAIEKKRKKSLFGGFFFYLLKKFRLQLSSRRGGKAIKNLVFAASLRKEYKKLLETERFQQTPVNG